MRARFVDAYDDILRKCSTPEAPWWIVPADHKWFRDLAVSEVLVRTLEERRARWESSLRARGRAALRAIRDVRRKRPA
jgi:hypothetical protein